MRNPQIVLFTAIYCFAQCAKSFAGVQPVSPGDALLKMADDFRAKATNDSAIIYYEKAGFEFARSNTPSKVIHCYTQAGIMLTRQDKYELAGANLNKALASGRAAHDTSSLLMAATYLALGVNYSAMSQFEQSLLFHYKALNIRLSIMGKFTADVATCYGNIGTVRFRQKDYNKAIEMQIVAKEIREQLFGENSVETVQSYVNLGNSYRENKQYPEALNYFRHALANKTIQLGAVHKDLARYYKNISDVYYLMGDKLKGDEYKDRALDMEKS